MPPIPKPENHSSPVRHAHLSQAAQVFEHHVRHTAENRQPAPIFGIGFGNLFKERRAGFQLGEVRHHRLPVGSSGFLDNQTCGMMFSDVTTAVPDEGI